MLFTGLILLLALPKVLEAQPVTKSEFGVGSQIIGSKDGWKGSLLSFQSIWQSTRFNVGVHSIATKGRNSSHSTNFLGTGATLSTANFYDWSLGATFGKGYTSSVRFEDRQTLNSGQFFWIISWEKTVFKTERISSQVGGKILQTVGSQPVSAHKSAARFLALTLAWKL